MPLPRRRGLSDRHLLAVTTLELGKGLVHSVRGFDDEGAILLRRCTELASAQGYVEVAAAGFRELGYVEALAGRRPSAADYLRTALEVARAPDELAAIHAFIGFNLVDWGKAEDGLGHYAIALDKARTAGDRQREIWSLGLGARAQLVVGDLDVAARWLHDCLRWSTSSSGSRSVPGRSRCWAKPRSAATRRWRRSAPAWRRLSR